MWVAVLEGVEAEGVSADPNSGQFLWIDLVGGGERGMGAGPIYLGPHGSHFAWLQDALFDAQDAVYRGEVKIIDDARRIIEGIRDRAQAAISPRVIAATNILIDWLLSEAKKHG